MRVHITGNAGAGKTTLGKTIANDLDLPFFGLDGIVWQPNWQKTPPEERKRLEEELIDKPEWVIEGVSNLVRRSADVTVFLDVPRTKCFIRATKRTLPNLFKTRPELPENCPEYKIIPQLIRIIWKFPEGVRPVILEDIAQGQNVMHLLDPRDYNQAELRRHLTCC